MLSRARTRPENHTGRRDDMAQDIISVLIRTLSESGSKYEPRMLF